jgi:hypothetical protein
VRKRRKINSNRTNRNQERDPRGEEEPAQESNAGQRIRVIEETVAQGSQGDEPKGEAGGADEEHHIYASNDLFAPLLVRQRGDWTPLHSLLETETIAQHTQSEEDIGEAEGQNEEDVDDLEVVIEVLEVFRGN